MSHSSITISWEKNSDGSTDISVCGEINSVPYFREAFLTLDTPPFIYGVTEKETDSENAGNSATVIAESRTEEKDTMVKVIVNLINKNN